jgi:hypothetical protein
MPRIIPNEDGISGGTLVLIKIARFGLMALTVFVAWGCSHSTSGGAPPAAGGGSAGVATGTVEPAPAAPSKPPFTRPTLDVQQGKYFTYSMPAGWKATETANGVDMTSPDGKLIASSVLLTGTPGSATPWSFVQTVLAQIGMTNVKQLHTRDLPPQKSGYPGIDWTIQEIEVACNDKSGSPRHASFTCGICNAYGSYSAILQTFSTPEGEYDQGKTWLPLLVEGVRVIDASKVAYQDHLIPPQNHPLDNSALMASWEARRKSQDHIAQQQHETTMGYERMVSPINGSHYNMPFERFDGTMGGYRDPADRNQILKHAPPGE